jgi:hypothetical protein
MDLQSIPFSRSGTYPVDPWSRWRDSNPRPADYKSAALSTELHRQAVFRRNESGEYTWRRSCKSNKNTKLFEVFRLMISNCLICWWGEVSPLAEASSSRLKVGTVGFDASHPASRLLGHLRRSSPRIPLSRGSQRCLPPADALGQQAATGSWQARNAPIRKNPIALSHGDIQ